MIRILSTYKHTLFVTVVLLFVIFLLAAAARNTFNDSYKDWQVYGGNKENIKYSALSEIDTGNVRQLRVAWKYSTGDASSTNTSDMKTNAIIVDGVLYGLSPQLKIFALDAATGKEKWVYDPVYIPVKGYNIGRGDFAYSTHISRGLTYYKGSEKDQRIFYAPGGGHLLYCLDALTGKVITSFGNNGKIDLHDDMGKEVHDLHISMTSPGIIYKDLIILGSRVSESAESVPGHIKAYDVHTGKLRWIFHTIPQPGEPGFESWEDPEAYKYYGGANAWGGFSLDEKRGLVFAGTGSATPDFYGGKRKGANLYSDCVLALDAATGKLKWHFQTVHHDVWDWDNAAHPILVAVRKDGKQIDAVVQVTKQGFIFMFDRETGKPVYPVEEVPVTTVSDLEREQLSPTQPVPTFFKPFVRQTFTEADLFKDIPDSSYQDIRKRFLSYKTGNMWNPPSKQGTLELPGWNGGAEWGGPSFDPKTGIMYINANESPFVVTMSEVKKEVTTSQQTNLQAGQVLYRTYCRGCHGTDRKGGKTNPALGTNPSLVGIEKMSNMIKGLKYTEATFKALISSGRNMMPSFSQLSEGEKTALASYILNIPSKQKEKFAKPVRKVNPYYDIPYAVGGGKFLTKEGYPAITPPWGTLTAVNMNTGEVVWKETLGDYPELKAKGIHSGTENFGAPAITAGGLLFIGATSDEKFRAYNKRTGELLWEVDLPAAGIATPSVYEVNGKQFVVIACGGGGKMRTKSGDTYVAFALPDK
jgi:quinoprotein glucose dehydrogenase